MKKWNIIAVAILTIFSASICLADTLVITYRSGKTQAVVLDEPSTTINSWKFVGGTTAATSQPQIAPQDASKTANAKADAKPAEKPDDKKSGVRFKWSAPIKD